MNMMQDDKFYVPRIEEFHEGFRFEFQFSHGTGWENAEFSLNSDGASDVEKDIQNKLIRVKKLDRDGIEELGWHTLHGAELESFRYMIEFTGMVDSRENHLILKYNLVSNWVLIYHFGEKGNAVNNFAGQVMNFNELKLIMEMCKIKKNAN